jgi:hypothetical protein
MASSELLELSEYGITDSKASVQDISEVQASLQRLASEEQTLREIKQQLLSQKSALQDKVSKEIEEKKKTIAFLKSEILDLRSENHQLEKALNLTVYNKPPELIPRAPNTVTTAKVPQTLHGCIGLLRCSKPEECESYTLCLNKYMTAEIRNDNFRL